jgi:hypothetical protein
MMLVGEVKLEDMAEKGNGRSFHTSPLLLVHVCRLRWYQSLIAGLSTVLAGGAQ